LRLSIGIEDARDLIADLRQNGALLLEYPHGFESSDRWWDSQPHPNFPQMKRPWGYLKYEVTYPTTQTHADIPAEVRHSYGLTDDLLRLSIGIEDARDLIADLRQALEG